MQVSVVIPVYNAERFVAEAVESALAQPETAQVILIEDGSADGSLAVCQRLADRDPRIELLRHPGGENRGAGSSRNLGVRAARFPYIAFLDADDFFLPERFHAARERFLADPCVDGVYDAVGTVYEDESLRQWWQGDADPEFSTVRGSVDPDGLFDAMLTGATLEICTDGIVVRSSLFERTGEFDAALRMCQDTAMWLKMAAVGRLVAGSISQPVSMRRLHGGNRIWKHQDRHYASRVQMGQILLDWGRTHGLSRDRLVLLVEDQLKYGLRRLKRDGRYVQRKARELRFLAGFAARNPLAWRSPNFRDVVSYTIGWQRFRKILRWP